MIRTSRLILRQTLEADRERFVELFGDEEFMVYSGGVLDVAAAHARFDTMLAVGAEMSFAKQPVIVAATSEIIGYAGVNWYDEAPAEGSPRQREFGWRLDPRHRGQGYATEAARALIDLARHTSSGELLAFIDPRNEPSKNVARKVGFAFSELAMVHGYLDEWWRLQLD